MCVMCCVQYNLDLNGNIKNVYLFDFDDYLKKKRIDLIEQKQQ